MPEEINLEQVYRDMADHTAPKCGDFCNSSCATRCCRREYCELARDWARGEYGIELQDTGHPDLPFMGENGCTVEPHLRPLCTVHQCSINSLGAIRGDPEWTDRYFNLRELIEQGEFQRTQHENSNRNRQ